MQALPLVVPLLLGAAGDLRVEAGGASTAVLRSLHTFGDSSGQAPLAATTAEMALLPRVSLIHGTRQRLELTYAPRLLVPAYVSGAPDGAGGPLDRLSHIHHVALSAETGRSFRLRGSAFVEAGKLDLLALSPGQPDGQQQDPATTVRTGTGKLDYLGAQVSLSLGGQIDRATAYSTQVVALSGGGAGEVAQRTLPIQRELRLEASVIRTASRRDVLTFTGATSFTRTAVAEAAPATVSDDTAIIARVGAGVRHLFHPSLSGALGGGYSATFADVLLPPPTTGAGQGRVILGPAVLRAMPWAEASLDHTPRGARPATGVRVAVEPAIDRLTGTVQIGASADLHASWSPLSRWTGDARVGYGVLEPWEGLAAVGSGYLSTRVVSGGVGLSHRLLENVSLAGRGTYSLQETDRVGMASFRELTGVLELSVTP